MQAGIPLKVPFGRLRAALSRRICRQAHDLRFLDFLRVSQELRLALMNSSRSSARNRRSRPIWIAVNSWRCTYRPTVSGEHRNTTAASSVVKTGGMGWIGNVLIALTLLQPNRPPLACRSVGLPLASIFLFSTHPCSASTIAVLPLAGRYSGAQWHGRSRTPLHPW